MSAIDAHERGNPIIRQARPADRIAIDRLLEQTDLPRVGIGEWLKHFWLAETDGDVVGLAGLEMYGDAALLRSVVVVPAWRGSGLGARLVKDALERARQAGCEKVYLLTTTAERYFPRHGFVPITREEVPQSVQASVEFQGACPASAVIMRRTLADVPAPDSP
jgi:amino-acid N-acetyltransferase